MNLRSSSLGALALLTLCSTAACGDAVADGPPEAVTDPSALCGPARDGGAGPYADASRAHDASAAAHDAAAGNGPSSPAADGGPHKPTLGSRCSEGRYKLCENFESAAVGSLPDGWSVAAGWNPGSPAVTDAEHHGGSKALSSAVASNGQPRASHSLSTLGATAGKHWGRVFYKVKAPAPLPDANAVIHNTLVGLKSSTESRVVDTVVNSQGKHQFLYNLPDDSCCGGSSYDYASYDGSWHCAEWYVDASTGTYRFFFEGSEVESIGFRDGSQPRAHLETFSAVLVGWINYQTPRQPYQAWFDDLAIDDARIGCDG